MNTNRLSERMGETLENITDQIADGLRRGQFTLEEVQEAIVERTQSAARKTDDYVHEHAWKTVGIVAAVGILIGLLLPRR